MDIGSGSVGIMTACLGLEKKNSQKGSANETSPGVKCPLGTVCMGQTDRRSWGGGGGETFRGGITCTSTP